MENYIKTQMELHELLNSELSETNVEITMNIDDEYKKMRKEYRDIINFTNKFFDKIDYTIAPHDGVISKIKYNDKGEININFTAFIYNKEKQEIGKQSFSLVGKVNMIKELKTKKNHTILNLSIDGNNNIGLITLDNDWNRQCDVISCSEINLKPLESMVSFNSYKRKKFK